MSSRFVPAGGGQDLKAADVDWEKARQEVDNQRTAKPVVSGKQEDGKSLYEVLQANKAAKQDAFEEAAKLRNQFRALDDSEVEFLESIRQTERVKENSVKQETAEQLDLFRKQRLAAEQAVEAANAVDPVIAVPKESWTSTKKRRRDDVNRIESSNKERRTSTSKKSGSPNISDAPANTSTTDSALVPTADKSMATKPTTTQVIETQTQSQPVLTGLGLAAYDSDDD